MSKVFLKASLVFLVLGLIGCTTVTRENIKSVVTAQKERRAEKDCPCEVNVIIVNESD